jgi:hypothetical protein
MYQRVVLSVLIFIGLTLNQTVNADISGKVSAQAGGPIKGATVKLVRNGATATTGADGMYALATTDVKTLPAPQPQNTDITLQKGFLNFSLPEEAPVKYEIFDVKGSLLKKEVLKNAQKGIYRLDIAENTRSTALLVIKASIGKKEKTFNYLPLNSNNVVHAQNRFSTPKSGGLAKITAVADTIKVTANGYKAQAIAITSYDMVVNVTMKPADGDCGEFTLKSNKMSTAIPTVGIVEWSYSKEVTSAHIEFGPQGSATVMKAPVDLKEPNYRTLLLGMKQQKSYVFRIVVNTGADTCVSDDYTLTTGTLSNAPKITKSGSGTSSMSGGFIVTTTGNGWGTGGGGGGTPMAVIFDIDGDVVWAASAPKGTSRARMSWDGRDMWVNNANVGNPNPSTAGEMRCISMDGLNVQNKVNGLSGAHHDFTVTPKNEVVTIAYTSSGTSSQILVRAANGTISTLMADVSTLYKPVGDCHPNYIQYYPSEDCFIISDRNPNLFVKFKRDGTLVWQFGGSNPKGKSFSVSETWQVNHGFEFEADGRFVFFNNGAGMGGGSSKIQEFKLNESTMSATKSWEKNTNGSSMSLGNVQRLPNGHYLVTVSNAGKMEELDSSRNVVWTFSTGEFGYAEFRESLYGPPIDY